MRKHWKEYGLLCVALLCCSLFLFGAAFMTRPAVRATISEVEQADAGESVRLPVIMYHSLLPDSRKSGPYVLSPVMFESDMQYLKDQGYTAVLPAELVEYAYGRADLPEKPVMITFDDGFYNNLVYALPILERTDMKAVLSVIGSVAEQFSISNDKNPNYAYVSWEDICMLRDSGRIEIANHSYDMHNMKGIRDGIKRKAGESQEEYREALTGDVETLQQVLLEKCELEPVAFAYPFGKWDDLSEEILCELGFEVLFTCRERVNILTRDPGQLYSLGRFNRPSGVDTPTFMKKVLAQ